MQAATKLASFVLVLLAAVAVPASSQEKGKREFLSGYAGVLPHDKSLKAGTYFDNPTVRNLIYALEAGPMNQADVMAALRGSQVTLEQLIRVRILRCESGTCSIGFNYFDRADMERVHEVARKYIPSLVTAYRRRQRDFNKLWSRYRAESVSREALGFVLIAGFSLNWDALKLTEEKGYRKPRLVSGENWQYSFWASEIVPGYSTTGFYWGSSTFPAGKFNYKPDPVDFAFSSFGDPESDPRMNFPDLLYIPAEAMTPNVREIASHVGLIRETSFGLDLKNVLGLDLGRVIGPLLFRLRAKPMSEAELRAALPETDPARLSPLLQLLVETEYLKRSDDGLYHLIVPVLDDEDRGMVEATLSLSRGVLTAWLAQNYPRMRKDLEGLTAARQGVPFESLFTQIWHELFGLATRELVASRFLADPRAEGRRYKGSLPTVWRTSLYEPPAS